MGQCDGEVEWVYFFETEYLLLSDTKEGGAGEGVGG